MDFDINLLLNFIPVISAALLTFITCFTVFYKLRNRWPIKVNCWFCNGNTKVHRQTLDWWLCPHCDQFNGFTKDGDYNYDIPEQHQLAKKAISKNLTYCQKNEFSSNQNKLCKECNRREEFKLLKLRELEDSMDVYNDKKIARFEKSFEKKYPLCLSCQTIVQKILHKQELWLTQYKMLFYKQKPIRKIIQNREIIEKILRIILSILASVTIYFTELWYLPLCGIFFQLAACLASPSGKRQSNIFPLLGWVFLTWIRVFSTAAILKMFKIHTDNNYVTNDETYQYFIITLGTAVGLANLKFQSHKSISKGHLAFKKLETQSRNISTSRSPSPETESLLGEESIKELPRQLCSPVNITDNLMSPTAVETPIPLKPYNLSQRSLEENRSYNYKNFSSKASNFSPNTESLFPKHCNYNNFSSKASNFSPDTESLFPKSCNYSNFSSRASNFSPNTESLFPKSCNYSNFSSRASNFSPNSESLFPKSYTEQTYSLNDSLSSLNSLSLGTSKKSSSPHSPKIFETKVYGTTSPDLFTKYQRYNQKRSILAPPKLRSMTQTSWVAGGYWQSGLDVPTLSRSSSQSSGFGSSGSNCGPSREPSIHEFDQCSVVSDQCYFARPESPLSLKNCTVKRASSNCSVRYGSTSELAGSNESLPRLVRCDTQCTGHTTIVTNPAWLPVLLCGSLVFNMVVLCTILLR